MTGTGEAGGARRSLPIDEKDYFSFGERDRSLLKGRWPNRDGLAKRAWKLSGSRGSLTRTLVVENGDRTKTELTETILRFPSAPIRAVHRPPEYPFKIEDEWPNYHTLRVLRRKGESSKETAPAAHVFLLHNGLNETREMSFHHRMAGWILSECPDAACIVRPLPGHLTRYPFQGPVSEQPLDEYLRDPAQVFRQFLRYMVETRWLLSALVPRRYYDVSTGCELLLNHKTPGRRDAGQLAKQIADEANLALGASQAAAERERGEDEEGDDKRVAPDPIEPEDVKQSIELLRDLIGWSALSNRRPNPSKVDSPALHVVGYSMGGFYAQSIFCAWPFAIASCSNLFAGGAIRDLAPTAFAHPEEWQTVLHGLRYELDEARADPDLFTPRGREEVGRSQGAGDEYSEASEGDEYVFGIERKVFEYLNRIFEDVFLQTGRGGYTTRLAEFSRRLLFILGGDDPIVRTRNVLDAAPPGGITMHQIGDVSHFPGDHAMPEEEEQRGYWLPEAGRTIARFAEKQAAKNLQEINASSWGESGHRPERPPIRIPADRALSNMLFEQELDSMIEMALVPRGRRGWLFIARNQIPTVFLGPNAIKKHATAMHHSEDLIQEYVGRLEDRAKLLEERCERKGLSLLIPSAQTLTNDPDEEDAARDRASDRAKFSKSETAIRYWPKQEINRETWGHFVDNWCGSRAVRSVDEKEYPPRKLKTIGPAWASRPGAKGEKIAVTMLPDVWFAVDRDFLANTLERDNERDEVEDGMVKFAARLTRKRTRPRAEEQLMRAMMSGAIKVIKVSAAEFNPRFRGRLLDGGSESDSAARLLIYWAMAHRASDLVLGPPESKG